jgi:hypothetical protein
MQRKTQDPTHRKTKKDKKIRTKQLYGKYKISRDGKCKAIEELPHARDRVLPNPH